METAIFDTAMGTFGIGWTAVGVARLQLPGLDRAALLARINRDGAVRGQPTRNVDALINRIEGYADGEAVDFADVAFDLTSVSEFNTRTYGLLLQTGWGETTTYGALARQWAMSGCRGRLGRRWGPIRSRC